MHLTDRGSISKIILETSLECLGKKNKNKQKGKNKWKWKFNSYKNLLGINVVMLIRFYCSCGLENKTFNKAFNTIDKQQIMKFQLLVLELRADFLFDSVRSFFSCWTDRKYRLKEHFLHFPLDCVEESGVRFFFCIEGSSTTIKYQKMKHDIFVKNSSLGLIFCSMSHESVRIKSNVLIKKN